VETQEGSDRKPFDLCERSFLFALSIVRLCQRLEQTRSTATWVLSKQLLRSATSVGANIEEAQGGQSRADFVSKYSIARKEIRETNYWLRLLLASGIVTDNDGQPILTESDELRKILTAIIKKSKM
jgi:four helix bundle protein